MTPDEKYIQPGFSINIGGQVCPVIDEYGVTDPGFVAVAKRVLWKTPSLAQHVASMIRSKPVSDGGGGTGDPRSVPVPFNLTALDDAHGIFATLARMLGGNTFAYARFNNGGEVVAYRGDPESADYQASITAMVEACERRLPDWIEHGDEESLTALAKHIKRLAGIANNHPQEEQARFMSAPCQACAEKIVRLPPEWMGDEATIVCSGCGKTYTELTYAVNLKMANYVAKIHTKEGKRAAQVRARLEKKHARA